MSIWGKFRRVAGGAVGGYVKGGPVGAATGAAVAIFTPPRVNMPTPASVGNPAGLPVVPPYGGFGGASVGTGVSIGGPSGVNVHWGASVGRGAGAPASQGGACPSGWHLNKHPLGATKRHGAMPARSMCVRNRHMNPLNGKAAMRSIRRLKRSAKISRKILGFAGGSKRTANSQRPGHKAGCGCVTCRRR